MLAPAGAYLPFGEVISIDDFAQFISQDIFLINKMLKHKVMGNVKLINGFEEENADMIKFKFIREDDELAAEIINEFLDVFGVPSGTQYEEDLQEELRYWPYFNDDLYEIFRKHPIKLVEYENNIRRIYEKVDRQEDELSKKSLILSSLIFTETMHKSVIISKLIKQNYYVSIYSRNHENKVKSIL